MTTRTEESKLKLDIDTFLRHEPAANDSVGIWTKRNKRLQLTRVENCPCEDGVARVVLVKSLVGTDIYRARTKVRGKTVTGWVDYGDLPRTGWRFLSAGKNAHLLKDTKI